MTMGEREREKSTAFHHARRKLSHLFHGGVIGHRPDSTMADLRHSREEEEKTKIKQNHDEEEI